MSAVPYTFANASGRVPASELDVNFANVKASADTAITVTGNAQPNITSVGTLDSLSVTGAVYAGQLSGNGNSLSNIQGANVSGAVATATYAITADSTSMANIAGTVTTNAQPNITSVGILNSVSVTGTVTAGRFTGSGNTLSNIQGANVNGQVSSALVAGTVSTAAQPNITSVGVLTTLSSTGLVITTGNVRGENVNASNVNAEYVIFSSDASKFQSASWTLVDTINANLASGNQTVTAAHTFSYYASNYNEVLWASSSGSDVGGTIVIPVQAVTANSVWNVNQQVGFQWANLSTANVTVVGVGAGPYTTVTLTMYAR